jgi:hypothetical protein
VIVRLVGAFPTHAGAVVVGLLLAVPGLKGVATTVSYMAAPWVLVAVLLEVLSCASYVAALLQVFERAPLLLGTWLALSEEAFGAAVALGGVGGVAVGAWLMVARGAPADRRALGGAVLVHERDQRTSKQSKCSKDSAPGSEAKEQRTQTKRPLNQQLRGSGPTQGPPPTSQTDRARTCTCQCGGNPASSEIAGEQREYRSAHVADPGGSYGPG